MPKVGDKQFPYTEEGIAAAQAESEATGLPIEEDDMTSELPQEEIEAVEEEAPQEEAEAAPLSEEILTKVFEVVFGEPFDSGDEDAQEQMQLLSSLLATDPELSAKLDSGELTISEFAIQLYRTMEEKRAVRSAEQAQ